MENNEAEKKREIKEMDHKDRLWELSDLLKHKTFVSKETQKMKREKTGRRFMQIIAENFPNLEEDTDFQIQEAQRTPIKFNKNQSLPRHTIVKFTT